MEEVQENIESAAELPAELKAVIEAAIYITDEPLSAEQIATAVEQPLEQVRSLLNKLVAEYAAPDHGLSIMDIPGVQGACVLNTLLNRKLVAAAGRKDVLGKPILYKTTREFLIQFGLSSLAELPTLKEFEELGRLALSDSDDVETGTPAGTPVQAPVEAESATENDEQQQSDA